MDIDSHLADDCVRAAGSDDIFNLHSRLDKEARGVQEFDDAAVVGSRVTCMVLKER